MTEGQEPNEPTHISAKTVTTDVEVDPLFLCSPVQETWALSRLLQEPRSAPVIRGMVVIELTTIYMSKLSYEEEEEEEGRERGRKVRS